MAGDGGASDRVTDARRYAPYAARYRAMAQTMSAKLRAGTMTPGEALRLSERLDALNRLFDADVQRWREADRPPNPPPPALVDP